ncbi:uncharacterized protein HMPREF1541_07810 [Cyphellophora europaea CBS 101466]|uniref:Threonine/serine exporter-like N-terminal domain-containing protein n=1 Tax=Cyphellophora europaea (strain CBS 101466) TaxID=1220924 RepID=W2RM95_CYPE1|nr:uncharacterized protein HMPREF1541_07810 [Cyphellophora europaea CBS 101466]ETN36823.1 hypothetical protein HMPREF1541_07810 [Cyphellophora europaea CBS 101466]
MDPAHNSPNITPDKDSGASSPRPGQTANFASGLKSALRQQQKVNFTLGDTSPSRPARPADHEAPLSPPVPTLRVPESEDIGEATLDNPEWNERTNAAAEKARSAAHRLYTDLSRNNSLEDLSDSTARQHRRHTSDPPATDLENQPRPHSSPPLRPLDTHPIRFDDIPLVSHEKPERPYDINEDTDEETDTDHLKPLERQQNVEHLQEAKRLVRSFTGKPNRRNSGTESGTRTPAADKRLHDLDYVPRPDHYKPGILGAILASRLSELEKNGNPPKDFYKSQAPQVDGWLSPGGRHTPKSSKRPPIHERAQSYDGSSAGSSGRTTPSKKTRWYDKSPSQTNGMGTLLAQASLSTAAPGAPGTPGAAPRPSFQRSKSADLISSAVDIIKKGAFPRTKPAYADSEADTIVEVADIIARREYLKKLCRAFMRYGAPTHRIEEYLRVSSRALYIDATFMYMPGAVLMTFPDTYTSHVELIREPASGIDFGRLKDAFDVYKCVIHDKYGAEEAAQLLDDISKRDNRYTTLFRVLVFGIAAICVGPFAFSARPIDMIPIFFMGSALGVFQLVVNPRSEQFSHVFEVATAFFTAFIARGLGSIRSHGEYLFCFSAMSQSSIALILPGYIVLNAALELQSRNMVSGSVRMVYAIIYTLFLGFGLLLGTVVYGLIDSNATDDVICSVPKYWTPGLNFWKLIYTRFIWVPLFACCLAIINQAKWRQLPVMALIAVLGYQANFWISVRLASNLQVANAIDAFVIGTAANLYSRWFHGVAAAAMLPAIFVLVPSGLAASGSLVAGVDSSKQLASNSTTVSIINNGTAGFVTAQENPSSVYNGTIFNVGYGMVQVAIGISVGLYLSALIVYPYGKRKSGLFSF